MIVTVTHSRVIGLLVLVIPMLIGTRRMIIRAILRAREGRDQPAHGERREGKQCRLQKVLAHGYPPRAKSETHSRGAAGRRQSRALPAHVGVSLQRVLSFKGLQESLFAKKT